MSPPGRTVPRRVAFFWWIYAELRWPLDARQLKRAGYHRTGWRRWESP